jgi:hypothetical protein
MDLHYDDNNASDLQQKLTELIRKKTEEMEVLQKLSDIIPGSVKNSTVTEHRIQETED